MFALTLILDCHEELPGIQPEDWQILNAEEQAKAKRFVLDRDRQQSIRATAGLRRAVGRYAGLAPEALVFERNAYGKPRLAAETAQRVSRPCEFNLSHSSGAILIGVAGHPLGVDVEHIAGRAFPESIMTTVFTASESERVRADPLGIQIAGFLHWSRKESLIKADGRGLSLDPGGIELRFESVPKQASEWARDCWQCEVAGQRYFGATVALKKGWVCAIACTDPIDRDAALRHWDEWHEHCLRLNILTGRR